MKPQPGWPSSSCPSPSFSPHGVDVCVVDMRISVAARKLWCIRRQLIILLVPLLFLPLLFTLPEKVSFYGEGLLTESAPLIYQVETGGIISSTLLFACAAARLHHFYVLLVNKPESPPPSSAHSGGSERGEPERSGVVMVRATERSHVSPAVVRGISAP